MTLNILYNILLNFFELHGFEIEIDMDEERTILISKDGNRVKVRYEVETLENPLRSSLLLDFYSHEDNTDDFEKEFVALCEKFCLLSPMEAQNLKKVVSL